MSKALNVFPVVSTLLLSAVALQAQVVPAPAVPQIGSSNPVSAEPPVPRPFTKPCTVTLFQNDAFEDFTPHKFAYTPPADCPGPWRKVVFTADFTVSEGRQFDRTAAFYIGKANIFYGTTAEPRKTLSPSWHVERDVTDLSAIFKQPQSGQADLGNFVGTYQGVVYNGIIYSTAKLEFYPTCAIEPAPRTPDIVVPVNGSGGDAGTLSTPTDEITQTLDLPRNVERVYLDVISQSQGSDEFWYLCVPADEASNLASCPGTGFRETEITLDGKPAGVAPVSPWIFTGGLDPYLWEPIPGVQTLEFRPYRVDLTPFAGVLSDGKTHTIGISVFNASNYFLATANLLVYTDHWSPVVHGDVLENTLELPSPVVTENISSGPEYTGSVDINSDRRYRIRGYITTSHGRTETTVEEGIHFSSDQTFDVASTKDIQDLKLTSTVRRHTTTREGFASFETESVYSFPLVLDYSYVVNPDKTSAQTVVVDQRSENASPEGFGQEHVRTKDTLTFDASGALSGPPSGSSTASYHGGDSFGHCYSETLKAVDQKLTAVDRDTHCH